MTQLCFPAAGNPTALEVVIYMTQAVIFDIVIQLQQPGRAIFELTGLSLLILLLFVKGHCE